MLIERKKSLLLVVDVQEKLAPAILDAETAVANNVRLISCARRLKVPVFVSEQYVRGLGPSVAAIREAAASSEAGAVPTVDVVFFEKIHFGCAGEPGVLEMLRATGRRQVLLTGMESHVCVLQTALGLLEAGFEVFLIADASSSRTAANRSAAVERLRAAGCGIVTTEMVLFEWLHKAGTDEFRALLPLIK